MPEFLFGASLGEELRRALKIERPVRSIKIEADCNHAASVTIEFVLLASERSEFGAIFEKYALIPRGTEREMS